MDVDFKEDLKEHACCTYQIDSFQVEINLLKGGELVIQLISIKSKRCFIGKFTFDSLPNIENNSLNDFDSIQQFTKDLMISIQSKQVSIYENGRIKMKYEMMKKNGKSVLKQFILPTEEFDMSDLQRMERNMAKVNTKVEELSKENSSLKERLEESLKRNEFLQKQNVTIRKLIEGHKAETEKYIKSLEEKKYLNCQKCLALGKEKYALEDQLKKNQKKMEEIFFNKPLSPEKKIEKQSQFSKIFKANKFVFVPDQKHQGFGNFKIDGRTIKKLIKSYQHSQVISNTCIQSGRSYFQVRIMHICDKYKVRLGVVQQSCKDDQSSSSSSSVIYYAYYHNEDTIYYSNNEDTFLGYGINKKMKVNQIVTLVLDTNAHMFEIWIEDEKVKECPINQKNWNKNMYAFVAIAEQESILELMD